MNCIICGQPSEERICEVCREVLERYNISDGILPKESSDRRRVKKTGGFNEDSEERVL